MPRGDSTLPPVPNYSFNPGANVDTGPAQIALQKQKQVFTQQQADQDTILKTTQMASQLVQSFVEASKKRQQEDAIRAYAAFDPNRPQVTTSSNGDMTAVPQGQTPEGQGMQRQLLARVMAGNPDMGAKLIGQQNAPPTSLPELAARQVFNGQNPQPAIDAQHDIMSPKAPKVIQGLGQDGQPHNFRLDPATNQKIDLGLAVPNSGSTRAAVQQESNVQRNLTDVAHQLKQEINNSPAAKTVAAADNFLNQVKRTQDGSVVVDKGTSAIIATELERALAGNGAVSQNRVEELMPQTLRAKGANLISYITNNPTDQNVQSFLKNYAVEVQAQRDQRSGIIEQSIKPILASAQLAQKRDPNGFNKTVEAAGLDSKAARNGEIKFLPGAYSLLYGKGRSATGITNPEPTHNWTDDKEKRYQELKAKLGH